MNDKSVVKEEEYGTDILWGVKGELYDGVRIWRAMIFFFRVESKSL